MMGIRAWATIEARRQSGCCLAASAQLADHPPSTDAAGRISPRVSGRPRSGRKRTASRLEHIDATPLPDPRVTDDPKLPRVLVIGDSISMNYHEAAKAALAGIANYHRNEGNAASSAARRAQHGALARRLSRKGFPLGCHPVQPRFPRPQTNLRRQDRHLGRILRAACRLQSQSRKADRHSAQDRCQAHLVRHHSRAERQQGHLRPPQRRFQNLQ